MRGGCKEQIKMRLFQHGRNSPNSNRSPVSRESEMIRHEKRKRGTINVRSRYYYHGSWLDYEVHNIIANGEDATWNI